MSYIFKRQYKKLKIYLKNTRILEKWQNRFCRIYLMIHIKQVRWVNSLHEVAKVLEFQLQHHSLQRNSRGDLLQNGLVGFGAGREGDDRGWDGWMASLTRWTWVWVNSGSWQWTGRPGVLWFMGSQRVRHNWATELNCTETG